MKSSAFLRTALFFLFSDFSDRGWDMLKNSICRFIKSSTTEKYQMHHFTNSKIIGGGGLFNYFSRFTLLLIKLQCTLFFMILSRVSWIQNPYLYSLHIYQTLSTSQCTRHVSQVLGEKKWQWQYGEQRGFYLHQLNPKQ